MVMGSVSACVSCGKTIYHGCVREIMDDYCDACHPFKRLVEGEARRYEDDLRKLAKEDGPSESTPQRERTRQARRGR